MDTLAISVVIYAGLLAMLLGFVSVLKPLRLLRIRSRRRGAALFALGLVSALVGGALPAPLRHAAGRLTRIDDFMPAYHFSEVHSIRVHAAPERAFRAIKSVTAREIRFFGLLMGLRNLPARLLGTDRPRPLPGYGLKSHEPKTEGAHEFAVSADGAKTARLAGRKTSFEYRIEAGRKPWATLDIGRAYEDALGKMGGTRVSQDGCCRSTHRFGRDGEAVWVEIAADEDGRRYRLTILEEGAPAEARPILDVFTRGEFLLLAEEPDRELVIGGPGQFWKGSAAPKLSSPKEFLEFEAPGYAKVVANFRVEDEGGGWSRVTTETRIFATDAPALRSFGAYWRLIYPGSSTIRREWLKAIKGRAEQGG